MMDKILGLLIMVPLIVLLWCICGYFIFLFAAADFPIC